MRKDYNFNNIDDLSLKRTAEKSDLKAPCINDNLLIVFLLGLFFLLSGKADAQCSNYFVYEGIGTATPSSGGTVVLTIKSHSCTVTLNATTGDVTITSSHSGGRTAQVAGN